MTTKTALDGGAWCDECHGARMVVKRVPVGHPDFQKPTPCPSCRPNAAAEKAEALSRMLPAERGTDWADFREDVHGPRLKGLIADIAGNGKGMLLLWGCPGTGKTYTMHLIGNIARRNNLSVVYMNAIELLNQFRESYDPDNDTAYAEVYRTVLECDVLLLDELDKLGSKTEWAQTQIHLLIDDRWRRCDHRATVAGANDLTAISATVLSRFKDKARGTVTHQMQPVDVRANGLDEAAKERRRRLADFLNKGPK